MNHKTILRSAAFALLLGAAAVQAAPVTVNYTVYTLGGSFWGNGSFVGTDADNNGKLSLGELSSFDGSNNVEGQTVTLPGLSGFGDFDIAANNWIANGTGWGSSGFAFFSWNGDSNSVNNTWARTVTDVTGGGTLPEPSSLALGAVALLGVVGARRRKAA